MKKLITIGIICMFLLTGLTAISTGELNNNKSTSNTKENPLDQKIYYNPKEIKLIGFGWGLKSFVQKQAPLLRSYYVKIKLTQDALNENSWIRTAEDEYYDLKEGTYTIVGGGTINYSKCKANWFGFFSRLGLFRHNQIDFFTRWAIKYVIVS